MDIQHLVDRLEDLIDEGRHLPLSKYTLIDEERALELIDQMRISIPEEIEKAARILAQRDRVLAQANEEAARIVQMARDKSEKMIDREAMVQAAQNRAANIVEQARQEAEGIMKDSDQYVLGTLSSLEQELNRTLQVVRNGISQVDKTPARVQPQQQAAPSPETQFAPPAAKEQEAVEVVANGNNKPEDKK